MSVRYRQLGVSLNNSDVVIQAGAVQWFIGDVNVKTDVKGVGDFAKKLIGSKVTQETAVKPRYIGTGLVVLEPTYKYLIIDNPIDWGESGMVIRDGMFLACDGHINMGVVARNTISSAVLGNNGMFNLNLKGDGNVILESDSPFDELVLLDLHDDVVKIDGAFALVWSNSLKFTVEKATKTLVGSAASGEGLVNVYRGTGKILMKPL